MDDFDLESSGIKVISSRRLQVSLAPDWQHPRPYKRYVTIKDVVSYFARQGGMGWMATVRSLGKISGDWRMIDNIAQDCLATFKEINLEGLRRESKRQGLEPKF